MPMRIYCDNKAHISIGHNWVFHGRTKHIEVDKHFIKENIDSGVICISYLPTTEQIADVLTKGLPLPKWQFNSLIDKLEMADITSLWGNVDHFLSCRYCIVLVVSFFLKRARVLNFINKIKTSAQSTSELYNTQIEGPRICRRTRTFLLGWHPKPASSPSINYRQLEQLIKYEPNPLPPHTKSPERTYQPIQNNYKR